MSPRPAVRLLVAATLGLLVTAGGDAVGQDSGQYKRLHQRALRLVVDGKPDEAVARLEELAAQDRDDPETWFALCAAHAARGDAEVAVDYALRAVQLGLPRGRFCAPPRAWFAPLAGDERFARILDEASPLVHGPTLGGLAADRVRVWVRTKGPATVTVVTTAEGGAAEPVEAEARTGVDDAADVEVNGLAADTRYAYRVRVDGEDAGGGTFRTAPAPGSATRFTIVFGGGAGFVPPNERVWTTIAAREPRALLLLGDNVYIDDPTRPAMQRYTYARRQSRPEWRALTARVPVFPIWDDHDFGTNDCIGGAARDVPPWKPAVWETFRSNWPDPGYGDGVGDLGCWHRFVMGDVEFFLLDGRAWRTDPKGESATMLGPVQKRWLLDALAKSRATFKVIASPVPWDYRTKGNSRDTWNGFRAERDEIFAFLTREGVEGVVLLSADRHRSDAWRIEREGDYALYEFNSSRLTNQHVHPEMAEAVFSYNDTQSFGEVTFDTTLDDPTVRYDVVTIDGEVVHSLELRQSDLSR